MINSNSNQCGWPGGIVWDIATPRYVSLEYFSSKPDQRAPCLFVWSGTAGSLAEILRSNNYRVKSAKNS